jgi:hypothetical protein
MLAESPVVVRWRRAGASAIGDRHLVDGTPCQDAFRFARIGESDAVAAVADGVSKAQASAVGAALAAELTAHVLADHLRAGARPADATTWAQLVHEALQDVADRMDAVAGTLLPELEHPAGSLRCTLALAIVSMPWVVVAAIGDCFAIVGRTTTDTLHLVLSPSLPGDRDGSPPTLPADVEALRIAALLDADITSVLLATDGMSSGLIEALGQPEERPGDAALRPLLEHLRADGDAHALADMLLNHADLRDRTGDDRTVAVLVRETTA